MIFVFQFLICGLTKVQKFPYFRYYGPKSRMWWDQSFTKEAQRSTLGWCVGHHTEWLTRGPQPLTWTRRLIDHRPEQLPELGRLRLLSFVLPSLMREEMTGVITFRWLYLESSLAVRQGLRMDQRWSPLHCPVLHHLMLLLVDGVSWACRTSMLRMYCR